MEFEPQIIATPPPAAPLISSPRHELVAPIWFTVVLLVIFLGNSYLGAKIMPTVQNTAPSERELILRYAFTIVWELLLLLLAWLGLKLRGMTLINLIKGRWEKRKPMKLKELIGGRWATPEDFLLDIAIGIGFYFVSYGLLLALGYLMGLGGPSQIKEAKKMVNMLGPQSGLSMAAFVLVSVTAGLVEEILFRGYLQRQIGAITGNIYAGLVGSAVLFGLAHGYQGARRMVLIGVLGAMFGLLALWRKSLRPGMMCHALFDSLQGVLLWMVKKGVIPLR